MNNRPVYNEGSNPGTNSFDQVQSGLLLRSTSNGVQSQFVGNDRGPSVKRSRSAPLCMLREDEHDLGSSDEDSMVHKRSVICEGGLGLKFAENESEPPLKKGPLTGLPEVPEVPKVTIQYHREDEHDLGSSDEDEDIEWEDGDECEDDGNDGSVEEICDPTYTLRSGEKVDVPIDWFERIESTDLQSIVEDALWILDQENLDYVRHKCSSDSHYLYERSEEFTSFINDCWRILIDKFNIFHETRYLDTISLMKKEMSHNSRCMLSFYSEQSSRIFGEDGDPAGVYLILQGLCARVRYDEHFQIHDAVRIMMFFNVGAWREILEGF